MSDGSYNWTCRATDDLDASTTAALKYFVIDTTDPIVNITYPINATTIYVGTEPYNLSVEATVSDNIGLGACIFYNGTANNSIVCGTNASVELGGGDYTLSWYVNDTLGNEATSEVTLQ